MKYPKEYLDEIKTRLKVSTVVSKTVNLKKRGKEFIGLSPFKTEKTPSFTVNDEKGFYHWFKGGKLNTSYLTLDYHVENGRADQTALIYDSPVTETVRRYSFQELKEEVSKFHQQFIIAAEKSIEKMQEKIK